MIARAAAWIVSLGMVPMATYLVMDEPTRREALGIVLGLAAIGLGLIVFAIMTDGMTTGRHRR